jgi:hypothetical protein
MSENDNNFEALRRLLVLKRYETPPPGYFNSFSSQVIKRIGAGEAGRADNWMEELFNHAPWLEKLVRAFEVKPVFAGAFAGALCLLLLVGIVYSERPDVASQPDLQTAVATASAGVPATMAAAAPALSQPAGQMGIVSSTNPVLSLQPNASLFGTPNSLVQPVSFTLPNH